MSRALKPGSGGFRGPSVTALPRAGGGDWLGRGGVGKPGQASPNGPVNVLCVCVCVCVCVRVHARV